MATVTLGTSAILQNNNNNTSIYSPSVLSGGMNVEYGIVNVNGGTITSNAGRSGGGVYAVNYSTINLVGGTSIFRCYFN